MNMQPALDGLRDAGREIIGDAAEALAELEAFINGLKADTSHLVDALAQATSMGGDTATWVNALKAQVDATALHSLVVLRRESAETAEKVRAAAMGALHTLIRVALLV